MSRGSKAYQQGNDADAEQWYLAALRRLSDAGPEDPRLATTLNTLAVFYHSRGQYALAEPLYEQVLGLLEQTLPLAHPALANTVNNLAVIYEVQGKYAAAASRYQRALALLEKVHGPEHTSVAAALENYADLLRKLQRHQEAAAMEARAQAIWARHQRPPSGK